MAKWIEVKRQRFKDGYAVSYIYYEKNRRCSCCFYDRDDNDPSKDTDFCPACGADMRGDDDE